MKRYIIAVFLMALVLMMVAGCAAPQAEPDDDTEPVRKSTPREQEPAPEPEEREEPEPEDEPEEVEARPPMNKKVAELLTKHEGRVKSLKYMYQDATMKPEEWETWIMGNKMHVKLREMDNIKGDVYIDNVYLNLATNDAEGYCERNVYRCADPNSPVDVQFRKYYRKTPIEWIQEVTYAEKEAEEQMQQRNVWKIWYEKDGEKTTMWVDEYYGVPVRVEVRSGGVKSEYIFEDIGFNAVDDSDLEHAFVTQSYN